jgi:hypothetical protein
LQYVLAARYANVNFINDANGNTLTQDGQIVFQFGDKRILESEMFEEGGGFDLTELRDDLDEKGMFSQDAFNALLQHLFLNTVEWLQAKGRKAQVALRGQSAAFLFYNHDRALAEEVLGQLKRQA